MAQNYLISTHAYKKAIFLLVAYATLVYFGSSFAAGSLATEDEPGTSRKRFDSIRYNTGFGKRPMQLLRRGEYNFE